VLCQLVALSGKEQVASQMTVKTRINILTILLVFAISYLPAAVSASGNSLPPSDLPTPESVMSAAENTQPGVLRELEINDLIKLTVVQQPHENRGFVSPVQDYVTEYQTATDFGTIGLLAHNYLAGQYFFQISAGQEIRLTDSNDRTERFVVTHIQRYQAIVPNSASSDFIDLATGEYLTASQLFRKTYGSRSGALILQTCIEAQQNQSWGRLFIIAEPVEPALT